MTKKTDLLNILFNYAYQVKKAIKRRKFNFSIIWYFREYVASGRKLEGNHLKTELPWITFHSYDFMNTVLKKDFVVYEFGSGGSSLFFSKRVKEVFSVEHDRQWYDHLSFELDKKEREYENLYLRLSVPTPRNSATKAVSISDKRFKDFDFWEYVNSILDFPDEYFDLVVIDGRARPFCLESSLPKLKSGGYIIFDNSDRFHYQEGLQKIRKWQVLESYGPTIGDLSFNQTSIFRKPKD